MIGKHEYYLRIAEAVSARANCRGRQVGAVLVKADRILATGYNGTAAGMPNCLNGGCKRCAERTVFESGTAYDLCSCVHAEANAVASAARFGIAIEGATLYTTHQPCFSCAKELIQAGVDKVYYGEAWPPDERVKEDYIRLQGRLASEEVAVSPPEEPGDAARPEKPAA